VASRVVTLITDDLDNSQADETVQFALDGTEFEIDLSETHAKELRITLEPYMKAGRKTGGRRSRRSRDGRTGGKEDLAGIRKWAKDQAMKVSERGRVSAEVRQAYDKAH
jgi:hypothetical protein